jgi:hypothetical protein
MYQDVETRIVFFTYVGGGKLPQQHESEAVSENGVQPAAWTAIVEILEEFIISAGVIDLLCDVTGVMK